MQWRVLGVIEVLGTLVASTVAWGAVSTSRTLTLSQSGEVSIDGGQSQRVRAGVNVDNFTWVALDKSGQRLARIEATLTLPAPVKEDEISHKLLAINGVESATSQLVNSTTIEYVATGVGPQATVSVIADFPKGYLDLPPIQAASVAIAELNNVWV